MAGPRSTIESPFGGEPERAGLGATVESWPRVSLYPPHGGRLEGWRVLGIEEAEVLHHPRVMEGCFAMTADERPRDGIGLRLQGAHPMRRVSCKPQEDRTSQGRPSQAPLSPLLLPGGSRSPGWPGEGGSPSPLVSFASSLYTHLS